MKKKKLTREHAGWTRGLGYAIAQIVRLHDSISIAEDVLMESGITYNDFATYVDDYDMKEINRLCKISPRLKAWKRRAK